ncbi:rod shape-determining protein MreC [Paenibacillus sp. JX-17]|uniref:Cell shape-determining protein MreC n=1 Tax=Paenibacillus lacisoli TaxID=3064525 RepID=A0ABT9CCA6_9BACL|nr:rod shape-determining protein MreC [Paenibacillus sp. JX-17]MDO7906886.1 rod shape-determining protein MreC [Paenibacillus sp. JX-17]
MLELFKLLGNKRLFILLIALVVFIALMGFTLGNRASLSWPEKFAKDTVGFVQNLFYRPASHIAGFFKDIGNLSEVYEENERLKIMEANYTRDQIKYSSLKEDNDRLQEDLNFTQMQKSKYNYDYRIAQVTSVNTDPNTKTLTIDIGSRDGVKTGMAVTSIQGLVGTISRVSNFTSTVRLLTTLDEKDSTSDAIAATVVGGENDSFGMIESYDRSSQMFRMTRIPVDDKIKKGDQIMSSGIGVDFPKYMLIGTVEKVTVSSMGLSKTALVKPAASFVDWKELFVVFTPEVPK